MAEITELSHNVFLLRDEKAKVGAFVEIMPTNRDFSYGDGSFNRGLTNTIDGQTHIRWGSDDAKVAEMHRLATDSPNKWKLIETRRDFLVGEGVGFGILKNDGKRKVREPLSESHRDYQAISDYLRALKKTGYWLDTAYQVCFSGNTFSGIPLDVQKRADLLTFNDCFETRIRALDQNERRVSAFLKNPAFGTVAFKKANSVALPAFDPKRPQAFPFSIYHGKHRLPGQPFYSFSSWWGTKSWAEVANKIPAFHLEGLVNGYNIKYLFKFPDDYFDVEGMDDEDEKKEYRDSILKRIKESLAGKKDMGVVTYYKQDVSSMKALPGVEIIPLKNDMSDDAYVSLFNTANIAQASGHGVLPILAGIDTGGKLGGSGKELEAAAMYQQKFMTAPDRELLLRPLIEAHDINGWDKNIIYWFDDIEVYIPDSTATASPANPNNPANKNK
jgi:hypothetical protein